MVNKMGTKPILPLLLSMAFPAMLSMLVQSMYNIVDSIFVSRLGEEALRAVTIAFPIQQLMIALFVGTSIGVNSLIARSLGERKQHQANATAQHGLWLAIVSGLIFVLVGIFVTPGFVRHYTSDPAVLSQGMAYMRVVTIFSMGLSMQVVTEKILQSSGNMVASMAVQMLGAILNLILDPILIFGLLGFPALGVKGAALATVIGQWVALAYGQWLLRKRITLVSVTDRQPLQWDVVKGIYQVGFPSIIMTSVGSFMIMFMNHILKPFSEVAITVLGNYFKLQSFIFMPVFGLTQGAMTIMGYNYGAGDKKRLMETHRYATIIAVVIMLVGTAVFRIFPRELLSIFSATDEMYAIGIPALRIISLCFVFAGVSIIISTAFQAIGMGTNSLVLSLIRQLGVIIPTFYILSKIDLHLVWYAFPIAEIVCMILSVLLMRQVYRKHISQLEPIDQLLEEAH